MTPHRTTVATYRVPGHNGIRTIHAQAVRPDGPDGPVRHHEVLDPATGEGAWACTPPVYGDAVKLAAHSGKPARSAVAAIKDATRTVRALTGLRQSTARLVVTEHRTDLINDHDLHVREAMRTTPITWGALVQRIVDGHTSPAGEPEVARAAFDLLRLSGITIEADIEGPVVIGSDGEPRPIDPDSQTITDPDGNVGPWPLTGVPNPWRIAEALARHLGHDFDPTGPSPQEHAADPRGPAAGGVTHVTANLDRYHVDRVRDWRHVDRVADTRPHATPDQVDLLRQHLIDHRDADTGGMPDIGPLDSLQFDDLLAIHIACHDDDYWADIGHDTPWLDATGRLLPDPSADTLRLASRLLGLPAADIRLRTIIDVDIDRTARKVRAAKDEAITRLVNAMVSREFDQHVAERRVREWWDDTGYDATQKVLIACAQRGIRAAMDVDNLIGIDRDQGDRPGRSFLTVFGRGDRCIDIDTNAQGVVIAERYSGQRRLDVRQLEIAGAVVRIDDIANGTTGFDDAVDAAVACVTQWATETNDR